MKHLYASRLTPAALMLFLAGTSHASAQPQPGNCELGTATGTLDVNDVSATMFTTGTLAWGLGSSGAEYVVPKDSGLSPLFASSLWVAGRVNDELRVAGALYGFGTWNDPGFEFWPGPLNADGTLPNPDDCSAWDRIWDISREDIEDYEETGIPTTDLAEWPLDLGAPVIDGDGIPDNYDLEAGDRPELIGDQALWWILNDVGNEHNSTLSDPIGMEVRIQAFSFSTDDALDQATFYKFTLAYKGETLLDSTHVTLFADPDLGSATDDYVGSDTTRGMGFVYNADNNDEGGYGSPPPALGYDLLQGPLVPAPGETWEDPDGTVYEDTTRLEMTTFNYFASNDGGSGNPDLAEHYWNYMRGFWLDGSPFRECGAGYGCDGPITTFVYPGDPVTEQFWSEENTDGEGTNTSASDRRFMLSTGPFSMQPGDEQEIVVAIVFGWGEDRLDSITELRAASDLAQAYYEAGFPVADEGEPSVPEALSLSSRPNPADRSTKLTFALEAPSEVKLEVYDVLGRRIATVAEHQLAAGPAEITLSTARWPAGTYVARLQAGERVDRHRFVVVH